MNTRSHADKINTSLGIGRAVRILPKGGHAMRWKRVYKRIKQINLEKILQRSLERKNKWQQLRQTSHPSAEKIPVFIAGCNRSGTNMVCAAIGRSPHGLAYQESEFSLAFKAYYLRADWIIDWLIRRSPAPIISFGSILDSQNIDFLLSRFRGAKAIWVYRDFQDVANSCARMQWGYHLKDFARWVAHGELEKLGARGKNISRETVKLFSDLFREDISIIDGACLYWYMRNQLFFELKLHLDARVLLVQYEDTVLNKEKVFRRIFSFLNYPFDREIVQNIYKSSVGKHPRPDIDPDIQEVCSSLQKKLGICHTRAKRLAIG